MLLGMTLIQSLNLRYMKKLFSSPEGRAHVLAQAADGEASGESAIFENALALVDDPELQRVIQKHRSDEQRHEQIFRARLAARVGSLHCVRHDREVVGDVQ